MTKVFVSAWTSSESLREDPVNKKHKPGYWVGFLNADGYLDTDSERATVFEHTDTIGITSAIRANMQRMTTLHYVYGTSLAESEDW